MEKLTTGQMLDQLGMEDVAVNQKGWMVGYNHKGDLLTWDKGEDKPESDENKFTLYYPWIEQDTWEINVPFVSFEEAQEAHLSYKKTIVFYLSKEKQYRFFYDGYTDFNQLLNSGLSLSELIQGKWIIEK